MFAWYPDTVFSAHPDTMYESVILELDLAKNRIQGFVPQTKGDFKNSIEWIFKTILKVFFSVAILLVSDILYEP